MINYINNDNGQRRPNKHNITSIFSNQNIIETINIDMYINHQKVSHQKVNHHQSYLIITETLIWTFQTVVIHS